MTTEQTPQTDVEQDVSFAIEQYIDVRTSNRSGVELPDKYKEYVFDVAVLACMAAVRGNGYTKSWDQELFGRLIEAGIETTYQQFDPKTRRMVARMVVKRRAGPSN